MTIQPISSPAEALSAAWHTQRAADRAPIPGEVLVTLPWPPAILSQNARPNRWQKAAATKAYRKACADSAWNAGITPMDHVTLTAVTFCPPDNRRRDKSNMIDAFKAGQDGLADAMGTDDATFNPDYHVAPPVPGGAILALITALPIPG